MFGAVSDVCRHSCLVGQRAKKCPPGPGTALSEATIKYSAVVHINKAKSLRLELCAHSRVAPLKPSPHLCQTATGQRDGTTALQLLKHHARHAGPKTAHTERGGS